jgi:hypothetical protein
VATLIQSISVLMRALRSFSSLSFGATPQSRTNVLETHRRAQEGPGPQ